MIKFYFFIYKEKTCKYGGCSQFAKIYRLKNNKLEFCLDCEWQTSSYKGVKSEVFTNLIDKNFIPKKWYNSSACEWRSGGYYAGDVCNHYLITEL